MPRHHSRARVFVVFAAKREWLILSAMNAISASFEELNKRLIEITEKLKVTTDHAERVLLLKDFRVLLNQAENAAGPNRF